MGYHAELETKLNPPLSNNSIPLNILSTQCICQSSTLITQNPMSKNLGHISSELKTPMQLLPPPQPLTA